MPEVRRRAVGDPATDQDPKSKQSSTAAEDSVHDSVISEPVADLSNLDTPQSALPSQQSAHQPNCRYYHPNEHTFLILELSRTQVFCGISIISVVVLTASIAASLVLNGPGYFNGDPLMFRMMGPEAFALFRQHDYDNDGMLSAREFEPLAHILVDVNVSLTYELPIEPDDNIITVTSHFEPLNVSTMSLVSKSIRSPDNIHEEKPLGGLLAWKKTNVEISNFAVKYFSAFLPRGYSENKELPQLGVPYHITPYGVPSGEENSLELRLSRLSSNRFYPPRVAGHVILLHNLLSMFHPNPFLNLRFAPRGAVASLRAYNDEWLDVVFRIHAEFQLNKPPLLPYWFTPAQFKGRLVISRDLKRIKYFNMQVPNNRRLNVDMEWLKGASETEMEVDIGYMPRMELRGTAPSRPSMWEGKDLRSAYRPELDEAAETALEDLSWSQEVQVDMCTRAMEIEFYPFQKIPYYNYTEAYDIAAKENKLIHSIVLWGALDDQSC